MIKSINFVLYMLWMRLSRHISLLTKATCSLRKCLWIWQNEGIWVSGWLDGGEGNRKGEGGKEGGCLALWNKTVLLMFKKKFIGSSIHQFWMETFTDKNCFLSNIKCGIVFSRPGQSQWLRYKQHCSISLTWSVNFLLPWLYCGAKPKQLEMVHAVIKQTMLDRSRRF